MGVEWVLGTGAGLAAYLEGGRKTVAVFGGEGSTNPWAPSTRGSNLAAVKKLPIMYIVGLNGYQLWSTAQRPIRWQPLAAGRRVWHPGNHGGRQRSPGGV